LQLLRRLQLHLQLLLLLLLLAAGSLRNTRLDLGVVGQRHTSLLSDNDS
jgi:hypothetical protein